MEESKDTGKEEFWTLEERKRGKKPDTEEFDEIAVLSVLPN